MHRSQKNAALAAIYSRHILNHHKFFTDKEMRLKEHRDWRVTFFPPHAMVVFILMSLTARLLLAWLICLNVGVLTMCTTTGKHLVNEFMHFCCHLDENWFVRHSPFVNTLRRHHTAQYKGHLMMEVNMNLTFVVAD